MIDNATLGLFREYLSSTPGGRQSTAGWSRFHSAHSAGAYDSAKPMRQVRPARTRDFYDFYGIGRDGKIGGRMALDEYDPERDGPLHYDADPEAQSMVESTDSEPVDQSGYPSGRAGGLGPHDQPPEHRRGLDPPTSERQRKAMHSAARGESKIGIPQSVGRHFIEEDQIPTELLSELEHEAHSVGAGQQGDMSEAERGLARHLAEQHGMSTGNIAKTLLLARNDRAEARDRARPRARDQGGPERFEGRPSAYTGVEGARLAGDSFARMYPHAADVGRGPGAISPITVAPSPRTPFQVR
jgi:hypothetical protein